ncbi:MAG: ARMT1-like domain-containing protein [Candidatus Omnitrophica bacterium]|nr:ARMT1-like domain-containing protein [Candidatus Omnitrophota bacterium]MDD5352036.1 ARMT1-like domain-containing protein [Candidatus Omnitrophota bacterium]MDD5551180.1 ARMT1-like domain-containing protein [Candidatus Omnitrophota bacterium]
MKTYLDCIPCFFRQVLEGARVVKASPKQQKQIIDEFARKIPEISLKVYPSEIARIGYALLKKISPSGDPYKDIKQKSNRIALRMLGKLRNKVNHSQDRLLTALELAIAGNIIDFGVKNNLNVKMELKKIIAEENKNIPKKSIFHYLEFRRVLKEAKNILYLADNAGEVVFDRILVEEIKKEYPNKNIYYAVKAKPVINDALFEDAKACGIDNSARVISNGTDAPGTVLALCSKEFKRIYKNADMVISKGQGNFESLSQEKRPIFFLFMVKCPVVAKETGCKLGNIVLFYNLKKNGTA